MLQKVFILSAKKWNLVDEKTGEYKSGLTVHYVNNIEPISPSSDHKGVLPIKGSFPEAEFVKLGDVPGYYNIDYDLGADSSGKPKLIYNSISPIK